MIEDTEDASSFSILNYASMTVAQLRGVAKDRGIHEYSGMNKKELIKVITS